MDITQAPYKLYANESLNLSQFNTPLFSTASTQLKCIKYKISYYNLADF